MRGTTMPRRMMTTEEEAAAMGEGMRRCIRTA